MKFKLQVKIDGEWKYIKSSEGYEYLYSSYDEALRILRVCYPLSIMGEEIRIKEIKDETIY